MVALLRGINVGGSGKLPMEELRAAAESIGLTQVRTYIQSGNVVFAAPGREPDVVSSELRAAIAQTTAVDPEVIVRTRDDLAVTVDADPFVARGDDPAHVHIRFFADDARRLLEGLDLAPFAPEEVVPLGREMHVLLPTGAGRSKLAVALDRHLGRVGTMRSWRTVTTLLGMLDEVG